MHEHIIFTLSGDWLILKICATFRIQISKLYVLYVHVCVCVRLNSYWDGATSLIRQTGEAEDGTWNTCVQGERFAVSNIPWQLLYCVYEFYANNMLTAITLFILDTDKTGTLANSKDPDEMPLKPAFHQGLHCLIK